ncbi:MAG TPA: hypothetical protein VF551_09730, partial [Chthoniobacterales bacterium]
LKHSTDKGATWSSPVRVDPPTGPFATKVNLFPWIETGPTPGSVGIVWYGTKQAANDDNAQWKVYFAQSFNANGNAPEFRVAEVTEPQHFIHGSNISEMGLNPTGGSNRNLIDYFQVSFDPLGAAVIAYTDDHNDFDGNVYVARQISGPGIKGTDLPAIAEGASLGPPAATASVEIDDVFPPAQPGPNGEQVTDFPLDVQSALVTRVRTPDALDILSVKYDSPGTGAAQRISAVIKVSDLTVIPQGSFWRAHFVANAPNSVLSPDGSYTFGISDDGNQFYVEAQTTDAGAQTFVYGTAVRNPDGSITHNEIGAADAGAFDTVNDTITVEVSLTKLNAVLSAAMRPLITTGSVLTGLRARAVTVDVVAPPPAGRQGRRDITRGGTQFVVGGSSIVPISAVSRKTHGGAGTFDVPLALTGAPGVEPRSGGASSDYQVVITFANSVAVPGGVTVNAPKGGSVSSFNISGSEVTVNLTGVASKQVLTILLNGLTDGSNVGSASIPMGVVVGDTTGDGTDNVGDAQQTRNRSGELTNATNFRSDVNTDGTVNSGDAFIVRARSGDSINP